MGHAAELAGQVLVQIWVDADATPLVIKEILYRAADRAQIVMTLIANMPLRIPLSSFIKTVRVPKGFDVADHTSSSTWSRVTW